MFEMLEFEFRPRAAMGRTARPVLPRRPARPVRWAGVSGGVWPEPYRLDICPPQDEAAQHGELPARLRTVLRKVKPELRPTYEPAGTLAQAIADGGVRGAGLYLLDFTGGAPGVYSGMSMNLRQRLLKHRQCAHILGTPADSIAVYIATLPEAPRLSPDDLQRALRKREIGVNAALRAHYRGRGANQRLELEAELSGAAGAHHGACGCRRCRRAAFEVLRFGAP